MKEELMLLMNKLRKMHGEIMERNLDGILFIRGIGNHGNKLITIGITIVLEPIGSLSTVDKKKPVEIKLKKILGETVVRSTDGMIFHQWLFIKINGNHGNKLNLMTNINTLWVLQDKVKKKESKLLILKLQLMLGEIMVQRLHGENFLKKIQENGHQNNKKNF